jgi:hypothetical protein
VKPPDGAALLDAVRAFLSRFVAFPTDHALTAATLWAAHTHLMSAWENTARLALLSPEPGSGKTRVLEVLELLTPEPMHVLNASPAAIFRTIEKDRPVLLLDEVDTVFSRNGKDDDQDLRGLLNSGYRRGATIPRCSGPLHEVRMFPTFCAVALAGLGDLPDTLMTRSVIIRMRRRAPGEHVEPFRRRLHGGEGEALCKQLAAWSKAIVGEVTDVYPDLPTGITDRPADVWEPLLAVADAAGGEWPELARQACVALVKAAQSTDSGSLGVRLLTDLRAVFGASQTLSTETILTGLHALPEAPWSDLRGKPLDARGLARRLSAYEVQSTKVKIDGRPVQGYRREHLWDTWQRYLPPVSATPEPPEPPELAWSETCDQVPDDEQVPEPGFEVEPEDPPLTCDVPAVPEVLDFREAERVPPRATSSPARGGTRADESQRDEWVAAQVTIDPQPVGTIAAALSADVWETEHALKRLAVQGHVQRHNSHGGRPAAWSLPSNGRAAS